MQYTIRNIPKRLDEALRRKAREEHRSLNEVVVETMEHGLGLTGEKKVYRDLDWLIGSGPLEPEVIRALEEQDQIHPDEMREVWGIDPETGEKLK
jgi:hypothetical protein